MARGRKLPVFLRGPEWAPLVAAAECDRDALILSIGLYCGLRVSEIAKLRIQDIDLDGGQLLVSEGKGGKDRYVPLAASLYRPLKDFMAGRREGYLFPAVRNRGSAHLSVRTIQRMVTAAAERAEIPRHVTPHKLRHSFATRCLDTGANLREVQQLMGHSSVATTEIYTHVSVGRLKGAVDRL